MVTSVGLRYLIILKKQKFMNFRILTVKKGKKKSNFACLCFGSIVLIPHISYKVSDDKQVTVNCFKVKI